MKKPFFSEDDAGTPLKGAFASLKEKVLEWEDFLYLGKNRAIYRSVLKTIEKLLIERMLERTEGNQLKAARLLGINRNTINSKIKRLRINLSEFKPGCFS